MTFNILRVIWIFIHMLYTVMQHIYVLWIYIRRKWFKLLSQDLGLGTTGLSENFGFMTVSKHAKLLAKVPAHVVIIFGDDAVSINDLANITIWCIAAGISCLSFYDHHGVLSKMDSELYAALSKLGKLGNLCLSKIIWGTKSISQENHVPMKNGNGTNGYSLQRLNVNVFSLSDGQQSLVDVAKSLCPCDSTVKLKYSDINIKVINSMLHKTLNITEVDLAICCGNTLSTYGFLPWHTRVTEFVQLQSHHNIAVNDFISLLDVYSKCDQRFGK